MPLGTVTVHRAVPIEARKSETWVEGQRAVDREKGIPFSVLLQLPTGGAEEVVPRGRRTVRQPQILYEPFDDEGNDVLLSAEDELEVTAPELTGPEPVCWEVDGEPTPLAKPGHLIGYLARLKRVED